MSKLKAVKPDEAKESKPKILIFGGPGVGKTFTSLDFPKCYYEDTEGGANRKQYRDKLKASGGVYFGPEQGSLDFDTVIEQTQALGTEKHDYKTLIIDSFTKLFNTAIAAEYERLTNKGSKIEFGIEKKPATSYAKRLINWLSRIDMNVILICHEKPLWKQGEQVGVTFDGWEKIEYEFDLVLNIFKNGKSHLARVTKSRIEGFETGEVFTWSYEEFANKYGKEIIEGESVAIQLATEAQLKEIASLIDKIKLPEGQVEKWLNAEQVDDWAELSQDRINAYIGHIKKKYFNTEKGE